MVQKKRKSSSDRWSEPPWPLGRCPVLSARGQWLCCGPFKFLQFSRFSDHHGSFEASRAFWMSLSSLLILMDHPPCRLGWAVGRIEMKLSCTEHYLNTSVVTPMKEWYRARWVCSKKRDLTSSAGLGKVSRGGKFKLTLKGWLEIVCWGREFH